MWAVVGIGTLVLLGLATAVGLAIDRQARTQAWERVADSRRMNATTRRELEELALTLDVRCADLDLRERRVEFREDRLFRYEEQMQQLERDLHRLDDTTG